MASTRIAFIGDLHYPRETGRLAQLVNTVKPHILVFNGDFLDTPTEKSLAKFTKLLKRFRAEEILFTLGNHEHYLSRNKLRKHWSSLDQARRVADALESEGYLVLDYSEGYSTGDVFIAGNVGWYDYTLGPEEYSESDYENCNPFKVGLGDLYQCEFKHQYHKCPEWWRKDCLYINLPYPHKEYVKKNIDRLNRQLENHKDEIGIVVYHHAPRKELLDHSLSLEEQFDYAYAGSTKLDQPIRKHGNVKLVAYGHLHNKTPRRVTVIQGVTYVNTYPFHRREPGVLVLNVDHRSGRMDLSFIRI